MKTPIDNLINDLKDSSVIGNSNSNSYTIHKSQLYYLNNFIAKYNLITYITNQDNYGNINYTVVWVGGEAWCERERIQRSDRNKILDEFQKEMINGLDSSSDSKTIDVKFLLPKNTTLSFKMNPTTKKFSCTNFNMVSSRIFNTIHLMNFDIK